MKVSSLLVVGLALCAGSVSMAQEAPAAPAAQKATAPLTDAEKVALKKAAYIMMVELLDASSKDAEFFAALSDPEQENSPKMVAMQLKAFTAIMNVPGLPANVKAEIAESMPILEKMLTEKSPDKLTELREQLNKLDDGTGEEAEKVRKEGMEEGRTLVEQMIAQQGPVMMEKLKKENPNMQLPELQKKVVPMLMADVAKALRDKAAQM